MKKWTWLFVFFLFSYVTFVVASVPEENETLYFNIIAYNGKEFSSTFCSKISKEIYFLSNTSNFLTLHQSLLYRWDIDDRYYLDNKKLNIPVLEHMPGNIEIYREDSLYAKIEPTFYVYYKDVDEYNEVSWRMFKGEDAKKRYREYTQKLEEYKVKLIEYNERLARFKEDYNKNVKRIQELYNRGQRKEAENLMTKVIDEARKNYPFEPEPPKIVVPIPQVGFIINLPEGLYTLFYKTNEGKILQESEKTLQVFPMRRRDIIGYKVIPEDKWTRPVTVSNPGQVIYVNGESDLFLQPQIENEYPELYINRLMDNQSTGNKHIWSWATVKSVHGGKIEIASNRQFKNKTILSEIPYFVQKSQETRLGYEIIDFNSIDSEEKTVTPSFYGYRLGKDVMDIRTIYFRYMSTDGSASKGSMRIIKPVSGLRLPYWIIGFIIFPLLFGILYIVIRNRRFIEG